MGVDENKAIVQRFLDEVVGRGDMGAAAALCAPDVINHAAAPDRQQGAENIKTVLEFSRRAQPDQRWVERHFVAEADLVVVYGRRDGTWLASSFRGVNTPVGQGVSIELAHMFRLRDGKSPSIGRSPTTWACSSSWAPFDPRLSVVLVRARTRCANFEAGTSLCRGTGAPSGAKFRHRDR